MRVAVWPLHHAASALVDRMSGTVDIVRLDAYDDLARNRVVDRRCQGESYRATVEGSKVIAIAKLQRETRVSV